MSCLSPSLPHTPVYTQFPPYALTTLTKLYGSKQAFVSKLSNILTTPGTFDYGSYGQQIHEMVEARALGECEYV